MKVHELTHDQLTTLVKEHPIWVCKHRPKWASLNRPDLMVVYRPEVIIHFFARTSR